MRRAPLAHGLALITVASIACGIIGTSLPQDGFASWTLADILFPAVMLVVGWTLAWRRPGIALGWIMIAVALSSALRGPTDLLGVALLPAAPHLATWLLWYGGNGPWSWIPPIGLIFTQLPLRFPDGLLPSPRWRWFSRTTVGFLAITCVIEAVTSAGHVARGVPNPTYLNLGAAAAPLGLFAIVLLFAAVIGSVSSLFVRYRRGGTVERAQLRWVFWALAVVTGLLVVDFLEGSIFGDDSTPGLAGQIAGAGQVVTTAAYFLIPIAILVAVLRHGLYSIDRIVSRTAAYLIVTLAVVTVYAGVVLLVSLLLPDQTSVSVAVATLAAAAVFLPLLRIVRSSVDRRFNRAQYDAEKVLDAFGERIRTGADPHGAARDLVAAVERTLQPTAIGIWTPR